MADTHEKIDAIIADAITEKTFSLEAVEAIKKMREENKSLTLENNYLKEQELDLQTTNSRLSTENATLKTKEADVAAREVAVERKEREQMINDLKVQHAVDRHHDVFEMMKIVFKNPEVRKQVYKNTSTPVATGMGGTMTVQGNESETQTTEVG